jgi:hypothetical protein
MTNFPLSASVTLNLFQGPSCSTIGACGGKTGLATLRSNSRIERADKWTLERSHLKVKQVQGDGVCGG